MSNYEWTEPAYSGPVLVADVAEDVTAKLYIDYQDDVQVELIVSGEGVHGVMGNHASTVRSQDWPEVERFIPREEWPEQIYAGVRGPDVRTPDEAVAKAVADALKEWEEADAEAEAYEHEFEAMVDAKRTPYTYPEWETDGPVTANNPLRHYCNAQLADGGALILRVNQSNSGGYAPAVLRYDKRGRRMATTRREAEWPTIEEVYPREIWPKSFHGSRADRHTEDHVLANLVDRMVNMDMWLRVRECLIRGGDVAALGRKLKPLVERYDVHSMSC